MADCMLHWTALFAARGDPSKGMRIPFETNLVYHLHTRILSPPEPQSPDEMRDIVRSALA